ncbi:hypothetical protein Tco_1404222 [Tanacetum coccineum]
MQIVKTISIEEITSNKIEETFQPRSGLSTQVNQTSSSSTVATSRTAFVSQTHVFTCRQKQDFERYVTANDAVLRKDAKLKLLLPVLELFLTRNPNPEPSVSPDVAPIPKASIPFPSRRNDERRKEKANDQIENFYTEISRDLSFEISFTDA